MDYPTLLNVYQNITGKPGSDADFNQWVQGIVNASGSTSGVEGISPGFFNSPAGQSYVQSTTTAATPGTASGPGGTSATGLQPNSVGADGTFGPLVVPEVNSGDFTQAPSPTVTGGNYNQVQNATQGGQFGTVGLNTQSQTGTTGQDTTGTQTQSGTSTTNQTQSGTSTNEQDTTNESRNYGGSSSATQGAEFTTALDTLGFGKLLQDQATGTVAADAERQGWLKDVMNTGGTGFNGQVDQAVRQSLSGPRMSGAGQSAQARAAGYAASDIGRNNLNQRLGAAEQLAGPTGLAQLSTAANPFIGKATTSAGNTTAFQDLLTSGKTNTSGTQASTGTTSGTTASNSTTNSSGSTTGFQDLVTNGAETQAGTTSGQSSQAGAGQIPQGQPVKTGGCVLCTAAIEMNLPKANMLRVLRRVIDFKLNVDRSTYANAARGYFAVFTPVARWLLSHPVLALLLWPLARAIVYEELRISGRRLPLKYGAKVTHFIGHNFCAAVGRFFPVSGHVTDPVITDIARRNNILFEVKS